MRCSNCGTESPEGMKFCGECGSPLRRPTSDAELRQLTVLFCDLVGSTALAERLDPEDLRDVTGAYHVVCVEAIRGHGGHIAQYLGDGILVYFGYPAAHEDDAKRAVRAALGILDGLSRVNPQLEAQRGITLHARIGIHTGPVVVGEVGAGERRERLALGKTPNVAARIQNVAEPDTVAVSDATYRIVSGFFDWSDLGSHELKGLAEVVTLHRALRESGAESRMDVGRRAGLTPLTGRSTELRLLEDRWASVQTEGGHVVLLRGEAGIGKSRIVAALSDRVEAQSGNVVECFCSPSYQNSSLYPIIASTERALGITPASSREHKLSALEALLERHGLLSAERLALMAQLLGVPSRAERGPLDIPAPLQRERTLETLVALLLAVARDEPTLWVVEDLHWADPSTLELVTRVIASGHDTPLLSILTFRPDFREPWPANGHVSSVSLNRLDGAETLSMVARVAGNKPLPDEVMRQLVERTEGVPLFVEEVTKAVLELGVLKERDDRYELAGPLPTDLIPATVQGSLIARLDRLGSAKPVAEMAATIGREFRFDVLRAVAALDEPALRDAIGRLVSAELVYQIAAPPNETYLFKHALIQDAAYQTVLKKSRRELHRRIAEAFVRDFPELTSNRPELVAAHFSNAGAAELAIPLWLRAGQLAAGRAAFHEAIAHLQRGLSLLRALPETTSRLEQELEFNIAITPALQMTRGWASPEVDRIFQRSNEVMERIGDTPHRLTVLSGAFAFHVLTGRVSQALSLATQVLELAKAVGDPGLLFIANGNCCVANLYHGAMRAAAEYAEAAYPLYSEERERWITSVAGMAGRVYLSCYYSEALWMLGLPDQAVRASERSVALGVEVGHAPSLAFAVGYQMEFYQLFRDPVRVLAIAEETIRLGREHGSAFWDPMATAYKGWALSQQGRHDDGIACMRDGITRYRSAGNGLTQVHLLALLAEGLGSCGRWDEALEVLDEAAAAATTNGEHYYEPEVYRLRGEYVAARARAQDASSGGGQASDDTRARLARAEDSVRRAIELAREQGARSLELRAAVSLVRLQQRAGNAAEGRRLVADVYSQFTEGHDTIDLREAREILAAPTG
jgi:class 3 adenylate cyclase/predicted ATPase